MTTESARAQLTIDEATNDIRERVATVYGHNEASAITERIAALIQANRRTPRYQPLDQGDALLIAYADHFRSADKSPLQTLADVRETLLHDQVSGVHVLPFFPSSGDGGFAVSDYDQVDPNNGAWSDIERLANDGRLMIDVVLNHCSKSHQWFQSYLAGDTKYAEYFIQESEDFDTTNVVRPRATPLFTSFESVDGPKSIWTTFGAEQVDLNFRSPDVLVDVIAIMLNYVKQGASLLRFDATHFMWKNSGSTCVHEPQTHEIVKILRTILDAVDPSVIVINETNVPHLENMTYFGDGFDEAQYVYNFALPALVAHTLQSQDATEFNAWAATLTPPSAQTGFFNYTSCHDGVAMRGASEILSPEQLGKLVANAIARGAQVLNRSTPTGEVPYELCITYFDLLADPTESLQQQIDRYMISQSIVAVLQGMPGIYVGNWFGAQSLQPTGLPGAHPRDVIRERFDIDALQKDLDDASSRYAQVFERMRAIFALRRTIPALHPTSPQTVLDLGPTLIAIQRGTQTGQRLIAIHNVASSPQTLKIPDLAGRTDLLTGRSLTEQMTLQPFEAIWAMG